MKRVLKKIALPMLLLSLLLLTACGGHQEQETTTAVGEHTHQYIAEDFPATCRTQGYTLHVCLDCKDTYTDNIIPVLPHTYTDEVVAPTCIAEGFTRHTCSACGDSYTDTPVEKQPHIWGETVIAPTCTAAGYTEHTCHFCHESYRVTEDTLIPRQDTEKLVELAIKLMPAGARFIDLCTGSGCVAVSTLAARKDCGAVAVDLFEKTLSIAGENAEHNGVGERLG